MARKFAKTDWRRAGPGGWLGWRSPTWPWRTPGEPFSPTSSEDETQVLARAVTWHAEHRILLNGNRTVILL
jgi:hypothetical protein